MPGLPDVDQDEEYIMVVGVTKDCGCGTFVALDRAQFEAPTADMDSLVQALAAVLTQRPPGEHNPAGCVELDPGRRRSVH